LALQSKLKNLKKRKQDGCKTKTKSTIKSGKKPFKKKALAEQVKKPSWFYKEPKANEMSKPKMCDDKPWYYCSKKTGRKCDGQYRRHKPTDCEGRAHKFEPREKAAKPEKEANNEQKLKLAKSYQVTLQTSVNEMEDTMSE
jgi:hypothetical protein